MAFTGQGISLPTAWYSNLKVFAQSVFFELFFLLGSGAILVGWGLAAYLGRPELLVISAVSAAGLGVVIIWPQHLLALARRNTETPGVVHRGNLLAMLLIYGMVWFSYGGAIALAPFRIAWNTNTFTTDRGNNKHNGMGSRLHFARSSRDGCTRTWPVCFTRD